MSIPAFQPNELLYDREIAGISPLLPTSKRYCHTPITQKENFLRAVRREHPLWIPKYGDWYPFLTRILPDAVAKGLVLDYEPFDPQQYGGPDFFGIPWYYEELAGGSMPVQNRKLLTNMNDWREFVRFPDVDGWDWEGAAEKNRDFLCRDRICQYWFFTGFFERLISFMDFEEAAVALIDEEQTGAIHEFFEELSDFYDRIIGKLKQYFDIDMLLFHDDAGTQLAPFFSVRTHREMIVPYLRRVAESCHKRGILMELHSCGKNQMLIENIVATGADMWTPQNNNDLDYLYENYGDQIMLGINADIKNISPATPEEDIIASARRFARKYGPHMEEKPVMSASWAAPSLYTETLYEECRKFMG